MEPHAIGAITAANPVTATPLQPAGAKPAVPRAPDKPGTDEAAAMAEPAGPQRDPRSLNFKVDGGRVITTIIDDNSKTVVIQIPDAEVIRIAKSIDRMQGFLVEQKA